MTQAQRDVYMALLMAGREDEATAYRDKVEAASYDSARARANANTYYVDKHGKKIEADMLISIGGKAPELVLLCGDDNLGVNASNPAYLEAHPEARQECYPLSEFASNDIEIIKEDISIARIAESPSWSPTSLARSVWSRRSRSLSPGRRSRNGPTCARRLSTSRLVTRFTTSSRPASRSPWSLLRRTSPLTATSCSCSRTACAIPTP